MMAATQPFTPDPNTPAGTQAAKLLRRQAKVILGNSLTNPSNGAARQGRQVTGGARISGGRG
jgi:hypothetical protein